MYCTMCRKFLLMDRLVREADWVGYRNRREIMGSVDSWGIVIRITNLDVHWDVDILAKFKLRTRLVALPTSLEDALLPKREYCQRRTSITRVIVHRRALAICRLIR